jgi:hypothetical protein
MIKKAAWLTAALIVLALSMALHVWPGTVPASVVPEGARWIAHLDMEKFVATDLFAQLEKDGQIKLNSRDLDRWFKIDLARDITGVTVFGLEGRSDDQAVVAVSGKFDRAGILKWLAREEDHEEIAYGAFTIYANDGDGYGAFVNDNLIVLSESRNAIQKALDAAGGKVKTFASSKLGAAFKEIPAGAFLSGVVEDLTGLGRELNQSKLVERASGLFFLAQEKQSLLHLRLQMAADSPENAKNIADLVQGLIALGRLSGGRGDMARFASLIDGVQVKLDGKTVRLEFEGPSREIAALLSRGRGIGGLLD